MTLQNTKPLALVSLLAIVCTWVITRAGPLDPPQGPVTPTMHTLDEIYNRGGGSAAWDGAVASSTTLGTHGVLVSGPGVLHSVYVPYLSTITVFYDWNDPNNPPPESARLATFFNTPNTPRTFEFDVKFINGLYVTNPGDPGMTVMYRMK